MLNHVAELQVVNDPEWLPLLAAFSVLRLDRLPPAYSGNKYFKLKYNIKHAKEQGFSRLLSFGGAYSNHIHALALAGQRCGLQTTGIIRGEKTQLLNDTLQDAQRAGMDLHFVNRQEYRLRNDSHYLAGLAAQFDGSYIIPEGGSNLNAVRGCMEIVDHIHYHVGDYYDTVVLPCGTAATMAGLVAAMPLNKTVIGISVLKNAESLTLNVAEHLDKLAVENSCNWRVEHDYHCGGYAKLNKKLLHFMDRFQSNNNMPLEPIYSGKMFYALLQMLQAGTIACDSRVIAIHTGGLQGLRGMQAKIKRFL